MKTLRIKLILGLSLMLTCVGTRNLHATSFVFSGLEYTVTSDKDNTVEVGVSRNNNSEFISKTKTINIYKEIDHEGETYTVTAIVDNGFSGCRSLEKIRMPSSVNSIGKGAFQGCRALSEISLPSSLTKIADNTFYNCASLTSLNIPESVTEIGNEAFSGCQNLKEINIPKSVSTLGEGVFEGCGSLTGILLPETLSRIEESTFSGCGALSSIDIPSTVTYIGYQAFAGCRNLKEIILPESVTYIGRHAFRGCRGIKEFIIPESVTTLEGDLFSSCTSLTKVKLPKKSTSIPYEMFSGCTALATIELPDSLTSIGEKAFADCLNLSKLDLPAALTEIKKEAFLNCFALKSISVSPDNPAFSTDGAVIYDKDKTVMLLYPSATGDIVIPEGIKGIGDYCFQDTQIESVTFPETLESIGSCAFYGSSLRKAELPASVTEIGGDAFGDCVSRFICHATTPPFTYGPFEDYQSWLFEDRQVYPPYIFVPEESMPLYLETPGWSSYSDYILPLEGPLKFYDWIYSFNVLSEEEATVEFAGSSPKNYYIPGGGEIHTGVPSTAHDYASDKTYTVVRVGDDIFYNVIGGYVKIPSTVKEIGANALRWCSEVYIPESVVKIHETSFCDNYHLRDFIVDENNPAYSGEGPVLYNKDRTQIVSYSGATGDAEIKEGVERIGAFAMAGSFVSELTLPESLKAIGESAFIRCDSIRKVTCHAFLPPVIEGEAEFLFEDRKGNELFPDIFVPAESLAAYVSAPVWERYMNHIFPLETNGADEIVTDASEKVYEVFTIDGKPVMTTTDRTLLDSLAKGIYIVNGKKIIR